jgi:hypothetical protein
MSGEHSPAERLVVPRPLVALARVAPAHSPREHDAERLAEGRAALSGPAFDFSRVRVHRNGPASHAADVLGARAFAYGRHVAFAAGEHRPDTVDGRRLIAHELAHVAQTGGDPAAGVHLRRRPVCHDGRLTREQYVDGVSWLEEQGAITSEEADELRAHVPSSRRARCRRIDDLAMRAERGRAGTPRDPRGHVRKEHLITNFEVTPRTIHTDHGEAARISFDAAPSAESVSAFLIRYEFTSERPDARFFTFGQHGGHKVAVWDGTFTGGRREPPQPGTYRVRVSVADRDGNQEERVEQIIVKNDTATTVLPRTESGLKLSSLRFDGHRAVLRDSGGNEISAQAVSGLRANNPHNIEHKDFTGPSHQDDGNRGPIPVGRYHILGGAAQMPEIVRGKLKYPSGATPTGWGPFRVPLLPDDPSKTFGRSEFFFHLDLKDDGTAGCIGISPKDEAKFNQMMALMLRIPPGERLTVEVAY